MTSTIDAPTKAGSGPKGFAHIPALDGLRGLAVLAVVLYHFLPDLVPAGFIGVDVFLVLSGFLITSLALVEVDRSGSMSIRGFFGRRARRLIPAAVATVIVVVIAARILDGDAMQASLRGQAVASLGYVANWWSIVQNNSYQATFGGESPLNHFWSLAVEEQFYLFFPAAFVGLALLLGRSRRSERVPHVLLICATVGAVVSAVLMSVLHDPMKDPSRPYLGTDTRSQALFVGIALACIVKIGPRLIDHRRSRAIIAVAGGVSIAFLALVAIRSDFHDSWLYDGGFLLIALATAAIILSSVASNSPVTRILHSSALRTLGLVSYGLYLWHWPIKVFVTSSRLGLPDTTAGDVELFAIRCAATAAATALSWYLIETPFRRRRPTGVEAKGSSPLRLTGYLAAPLLAIALVWIVAAPPAVAPTTSSADVAPASTASAAATGPLEILWYGDSVAWTLGGGIVRFPWPDGYDSPFDPSQIVIWNKGVAECPLLDLPSRNFNATRDGNSCRAWTDKQSDAIETFAPDVISWSGALRDTYDVNVDGSWVEFGSPAWESMYDDSLEGVREFANRSGALFMLLGQPDVLGSRSERKEASMLPENVWRFDRLREIQRRFAESHPSDTIFVDLQPLLCPEDTCITTAPDGTVVRPDLIHFSIDGARLMAPKITDAIEQAVARSRSGR